MRRSRGSFFTPDHLADEIVARTLGPLDAAKELEICDPACGDGAFLLAARRFLERLNRPPPRLVGIDIDPAAARAARERTGAEIACADALHRDWGIERFDAVIGNPPWISFSGRHAQPLEAARRAYLTRHYQTFTGWPSLHGPFVELAVHLARGRVGLLLPAQVCDLAGYAPVRRLLRKQGRIADLLDFGEKAFPGVTQPCCGLVWERCAEATTGGGAELHRPGARLLDLLASNPRPPPQAFADIGVHTGNCAGKLLDPEAGGLPMRVGRDIHPYRLDPPSHSIRTDLARCAGDSFRIGPIERSRQIPILLRQTARRPVAALHTEPALFRNSVLACRGLEGVDPALVVAWLNSSVVARYHAARVREAGQAAFPQLKVRHLRDLPMPDWSRPPPGLAAMARRATPRLAARLDATVSAWFGLDPTALR